MKKYWGKKTYALRPTSQKSYRIGFVGHILFKCDEMRFRSFYGKGFNKKIYWTIGCSSFGSIVVTNCPKERDVPGSIRGRD